MENNTASFDFFKVINTDEPVTIYRQDVRMAFMIVCVLIFMGCMYGLNYFFHLLNCKCLCFCCSKKSRHSSYSSIQMKMKDFGSQNMKGKLLKVVANLLSHKRCRQILLRYLIQANHTSACTWYIYMNM